MAEPNVGFLSHSVSTTAGGDRPDSLHNRQPTCEECLYTGVMGRVIDWL